MSVIKRGGVWFYDFTVNGDRFRGSTQQTDRKAALRVEATERERAKLGKVPGREPTLAEAADRWFTARAQGRRSSLDTARRIKILLRHLPGSMPVSHITASVIEDAIQSRRMEITRAGRAPTNGTVNRDLLDTTLRPILNYCADVLEWEVRRIPWAKLRLAEPRERKRPFTADELSAWRANLPEWHRPTWDFLALYGVRLKEAWFPLEALDVARGEVRLSRRKAGDTHIVPLLPEDAADMARRANKARAHGLSTVWYREVKGKLIPTHWRGFQTASMTALQRAGIEGARPAHDLRHHAGLSIRREGDALVAKALLGHADLRSTARYASPDMEALRNVLRHTKDTQRIFDRENLKEDNMLDDTGTGF